MRLFIVSLFLLAFLSASTLSLPVVPPGGDNASINTVNSGTSNFLFEGNGLFRTCQVLTQGGNLNVRNNYGSVIAKLPNRTWVRVITNDDDGYKYLITARVRGRYIRGWVAAEFIGNCY